MVADQNGRARLLTQTLQLLDEASHVIRRVLIASTKARSRINDDQLEVIDAGNCQQKTSNKVSRFHVPVTRSRRHQVILGGPRLYERSGERHVGDRGVRKG